MKFTPKTKEELSNLLPDGTYPFQISGAQEKVSKSGNEMIELTVRVFKPDGEFVIMTDYIMEKVAYKLRHASEACGLLHEYESGILVDQNFIGKEGYLKLKTQKDPNGVYADKNVVSDYVVKKDGTAPVRVKKEEKTAEINPDEIPF